MTKEASLHFQGSAEKTLDIERYGKEVHVSIDSPWAGDTEGGFGQSLGFTLDKDEARQLAAWINEQFP